MGDPYSELRTRCPAAVLRGRRIVRLTGSDLGRFQLDYATLYELGTANIGVLIGGSDSGTTYVKRLCEVRDLDLHGTIVMVTSSKQLADWCYAELSGSGGARQRPDVFEAGAVTLTTPERLRKLSPEVCEARPVLAVTLLDPHCIVYKARGTGGYGWVGNDRPQHLARFRHDHRKAEWQPPLLLMTTNPAKSLNTNQMLAPYGLEAWWFVDAFSLRAGPLPDADGRSTASEGVNIE